MGLIFVSHSSRDNDEAVAMRDWLATQGWKEVFLDLDPAAGLAPGQRWRDELRKKGEHCSAVIALVSPHWAASKWCLAEFLVAEQLGKEIFPLLIAPCSLSELPVELTTTYQLADISTAAIRTSGLERLRLGLQRAGLHPSAFPWPPKGEPTRPIFRGLRVLEEQDAAIFFGRDVQITKALDAIRRMRDGAPERMLAILGASGAGKSSFLRAGLLARLKRDPERFLILPTVRPGRAALTGPSGLGRSLGLEGPIDGAGIAARLAALRAPIVDRLRNYAPRPASAAARPPTVVLPVDQAEELFVAGDEEAVAAVALIVEATRVDPGLLLLLTIRTDSFGLLQGDARLSVIHCLPFNLPKLPSAAFKDIIEGPTRLPGVGIEIDAGLTELLIHDFAGDDALPLLAFTLERLIADHSTDGRIETREYLDEMKGVGGAIRMAVESAFARAADIPGLPHARAALDALAQRTFVPGLVRIDDAAAAPKRRVALRHQLPPEALPLIDCLVDQRLLVTDTSDTGPTVEVSHEAVLRHWRELEDWIVTRRGELSLFERVSVAARDWRNKEGRTKRELLVHRGEQLSDAEKLLLWDELRPQISDDIIAYLAACRDAETRAVAADVAQERRQRRLRRWIGGVIAAAAVVTVLGAALVVTGQRNLAYARSQTLARTADRFADQGDYVRGLRLSIVAARGNWLMPASPEGWDALSFSAQGLNLSADIRGHDAALWGAAFSHDDSRILTWSADHTARLWNAATGTSIAPILRHDAPVVGAAFSNDETRILTWTDDYTTRLWNARTGAPIGPPLRYHDRVVGAAFSSDETRILTWSEDNTARLWNVATGAPIAPALRHDALVVGAAFSHDETRILTWSLDYTAQLWNVATGAPIGPALRHDALVTGAAFSHHETRILTWSENTARLWNVATGAPIGPALRHDNLVVGAAFSHDETRILTWSLDNTARLWDVATSPSIGPVLRHDALVVGAAFSHDETRILTWSLDNTARVWSAATGAPIGPAFKHDAAVRGAAFSKNETRILTWGGDSARLWNAATGAPIGPAFRHDGAVEGAAFSHDETRILTWSDDHTARVWNAAIDAASGLPLRHDDRVEGAAFSRSQTKILTWSRDHTARLWNAATGAPIGPPLRHDEAVRGATFSNDENRILTWSDDHTARLWNVATGAIGPALRHDDRVEGAAFSRSETNVLTWSRDHTARLWNAATGAPIGPAFRHDGEVGGAAFSHDDSRILTWSGDMARLWNARTGTPIGPALRHDDTVGGAVFSHDEIRILTWSVDRTARLWEAATGAPIGPALRHDGVVMGAVFSKNETRILTWSTDHTARLWNAATGVPIGPPLKHDNWVGAVFSHDDSRILTWSLDRTARLWDAATGAPIRPALTHDEAVLGGAFSNDDSHILTWTVDHTARLWNVATGAPIGPPLRHDDVVVGAAFSNDDYRILTWSEDHTARLWDIHWAMRDAADPDFVQDVCREKLVGASMQTPFTTSAARGRVGVRHIDGRDITAAPILRGREGEDVCAPPPTIWQTLRSVVLSPVDK